MLLSVLGLWVGGSIRVGIVVSTSWVMLLTVLGSRGRRLPHFGDRGERTFLEVKKYLPDEGRWVSDDYNLYFRLKDHTVVSPVNPKESFHSSLRDRLIRFKRATNAVNRSIRTMMYSTALVLWERRLIPEFVA
jgi:hypothetical protein